MIIELILAPHLISFLDFLNMHVHIQKCDMSDLSLSTCKKNPINKSGTQQKNQLFRPEDFAPFTNGLNSKLLIFSSRVYSDPVHKHPISSTRPDKLNELLTP